MFDRIRARLISSRYDSHISQVAAFVEQSEFLNALQAINEALTVRWGKEAADIVTGSIVESELHDDRIQQGRVRTDALKELIARQFSEVPMTFAATTRETALLLSIARAISTAHERVPEVAEYVFHQVQSAFFLDRDLLGTQWDPEIGDHGEFVDPAGDDLHVYLVSAGIIDYVRENFKEFRNGRYEEARGAERMVAGFEKSGEKVAHIGAVHLGD